MTSVRIVVLDHYMCAPEPGMDPLMSDFRGAPVAKVPVLRIFGPTNKGEKACVHVHGVFPYMYVPCEGQENAKILSYQIASSLDKALNISMGQTASNHQHVYKIEIISAIPFYGYHSKEHKFFKIYFYNPLMVKRASELLQNGTVLGKIFQPHECHIPYHQQFMIDYNLHGMSFVRISSFQPRSPSKKVSVCEVEMDVTADVILNKYEISQGKVTTNPGIQYIKDDEVQRRRNKGEDTQLSPCLTQNRDDVKPTVTHETFKQFLKTKLECEADAGVTLSSDTSLDVSSLPETSMLNCSVLDDAEFLLNMLKDNENAEEDSILSQVPTVEEESDNEADLTMPLQSVTTPVKIRPRTDESSDEDLWNDSLFERTIIPQLDGATDDVVKPPRRKRGAEPAKINDCVIKIASDETFEVETVEGKSVAVFQRSPIVLRKRKDLGATSALTKKSNGGRKKQHVPSVPLEEGSEEKEQVGNDKTGGNKIATAADVDGTIKGVSGNKKRRKAQKVNTMSVPLTVESSDTKIPSENIRNKVTSPKIVLNENNKNPSALEFKGEPTENDKTGGNKIATTSDVDGIKGVSGNKRRRKDQKVNTKSVPMTVESSDTKIPTENIRNKVTSPKIVLNENNKDPSALEFKLVPEEKEKTGNNKTGGNKIATSDVDGIKGVSGNKRRKAQKVNTKSVPLTVESKKISTEDIRNKVTSTKIALNENNKISSAFESKPKSSRSKITEDVGDKLNIPGTSKTTKDSNKTTRKVPSVPEKTVKNTVHKKTTTNVKESTSIDVPSSSGHAKKAVKGKRNGAMTATLNGENVTLLHGKASKRKKYEEKALKAGRTSGIKSPTTNRSAEKASKSSQFKSESRKKQKIAQAIEIKLPLAHRSAEKVSNAKLESRKKQKIAQALEIKSPSPNKSAEKVSNAKSESRKRQKIAEALEKVESILTCLDKPSKKGPKSELKAKNRIVTPRKKVSNLVDEGFSELSELSVPKNLSTKENLSRETSGLLYKSESAAVVEKKGSPVKTNAHESSEIFTRSRSLTESSKTSSSTEETTASELSESTSAVSEKSFRVRMRKSNLYNAIFAKIPKASQSTPVARKHFLADEDDLDSSVWDVPKRSRISNNGEVGVLQKPETSMTIPNKSGEDCKKNLRVSPRRKQGFESVNECSPTREEVLQKPEAFMTIPNELGEDCRKNLRVSPRRTQGFDSINECSPKREENETIPNQSIANEDFRKILRVSPRRKEGFNFASVSIPNKCRENETVTNQSMANEDPKKILRVSPRRKQGFKFDSVNIPNKCSPQHGENNNGSTEPEDVNLGEINNNKSDWQLKKGNLESVINRLFSRNVPEQKPESPKPSCEDTNSTITQENKTNSDESSLYNMIQSVDFETMLNYEGESLKDTTSEEAFDIERYLDTIFVKEGAAVRQKIATDADGLPVQNELTNLYYEPPPFTASDYQNTSWVCEENSASVEHEEDYGKVVKRRFDELMQRQETIFEDFLAGYRRVLKNHHLDVSLLLKESVPQNDTFSVLQIDGQEDSSSEEDGGSPKIVARKRRRRSAKKYRPLDLIVKKSPSKTQSFLGGRRSDHQK